MSINPVTKLVEVFRVTLLRNTPQCTFFDAVVHGNCYESRFIRWVVIIVPQSDVTPRPADETIVVFGQRFYDITAGEVTRYHLTALSHEFRQLNRVILSSCLYFGGVNTQVFQHRFLLIPAID